MQDFLFVCLDIRKLMEECDLNINLKNERLLLICLRSKKPSVLIAHAIGLKETYKNMSHMLDIIKKRYFIKM